MGDAVGAGNTPPTTPPQGNAGGLANQNGDTSGGAGGGANAVGAAGTAPPGQGGGAGGAGVDISPSFTGAPNWNFWQVVAVVEQVM